jgi:hypothetical protein
VEHGEESLSALVVLSQTRWSVATEDPLGEREPFGVVHMEHATDGAREVGVVSIRRGGVETYLAPEASPAAATTTVDVVEVEIRLVQKRGQSHVAELPKLRSQTLPVDSQRAAYVGEHELACPTVQFDMTARRQRRESLLYFMGDATAAHA